MDWGLLEIWCRLSSPVAPSSLASSPSSQLPPQQQLAPSLSSQSSLPSQQSVPSSLLSQSSPPILASQPSQPQQYNLSAKSRVKASLRAAISKVISQHSQCIHPDLDRELKMQESELEDIETSYVFLRKTLIYRRAVYYYVAIILDLIGRFLFTISLSMLTFHNYHH